MIPAGDERARETVPEKLLRLVSVIVDVPEVLASSVGEAGLADVENSETLIIIVAE